MVKFKVGAKVRCTHSPSINTKLKENSIYTVVEVNDVGYGRLDATGDYWHSPYGFEFYEEHLPVWVNDPQPEERMHSHYYKDFGAYLDQETGRVLVDVYAVLDAFEVTEPELQHLAKKVLCLGMRGHKLDDEDLDNIIDTALRFKERRRLKALYKGRG